MRHSTTIIVNFFAAFALMSSPCYALNNSLVSLVAAKSAIQDLTNTLAELKKKTNVPVIFPNVVPPPSNNVKYYASSDLSAVSNGIAYTINVDSSKDCNGAHYCNIGSLRAEQGGNPQIFYDRNNKEITVIVALSNKTKGYYTPGHAMGDYFSPNLQWRNKNVLYTLSWNQNLNSAERDTLIRMVNSIAN